MSPKKNPSVAAFESEELPDPASDAPLLEVTDLRVSFPSEDGRVNAVRGVNLTVGRGEVLALVGESGSGKSVTSTAVMGLLDESAQISGSVRLHGTELLGRDDDYMSKIRGTQVSMVFQDPLSALTPVYTVGAQIVEALQIHNPKMDRRRAWDRAVELLELVGIPNPEVRARAYPHEFSGGMRQRAVIAIAIANDPNLIIADEPTTALDVTVQKQVVDLLNELRERLGFAMVFVSHDLALVAKVAHRITVMYAGQVVEQAATSELLTNPVHEYTRGLLGAVLSIESGSQRLHQVRGTVPSPGEFVRGDRFAPRSSHPGVGLNTRPVLKPVAGANDHYYAITPELEAVLAGEAH